MKHKVSMQFKSNLMGFSCVKTENSEKMIETHKFQTLAVENELCQA